MHAECEVLTREEERGLVVKALAGECLHVGTDDACQRCLARNRVVMGFYPLIIRDAKHIAARFRFHKEIADVVQVGIAAALRGFSSFDVGLGVRASTYFVRVAKRAMWKFAIFTDRSIRLPHRSHLPAHLQRASDRSVKIASLQAPILDWDGRHCEVGDTLAARDEARPDTEQLVLLARALRFLCPRALEVIQRRMDGETLQEVGEHLGVSREWARQLEAAAHATIAAIMADRRRNPTQSTVK